MGHKRHMIRFSVFRPSLVAFLATSTCVCQTAEYSTSYLSDTAAAPQSLNVTTTQAPPLASPAAYIDVTSIFPIIPYSFRTGARTAATDWNIATQWVLRVGNATNLAQRVFALTSLGIWQALQANEMASSPADPTGVASYAGHLLLTNMFPVYFSMYDQLLAQHVARLSEDEKAAAVATASPVVVKLLASRLNDGFQDPQRSPPTNAAPGQFKDVGTGNFRAVQQYATATPLLLPANLSSVDFIANFTPPAQYPSAGYNAQLTATLLIGQNSSSVRTQTQTSTATFWSDGGAGTTGIPGHWNQLVLATMPANITLERSALLLAQMNVAIYDTTVAVFYLKYVFNRWRPVTAIRTGDDLHLPNPSWTPFLQTPNNPTYPSAQGGYAGLSEIILAEFYGTDAHSFSLGTEVTVNGITLSARTYPSFSFAASEVTQSRYFGGIENPADAQAGRAIGQSVGQYLLENFEDVLSPIQE